MKSNIINNWYIDSFQKRWCEFLRFKLAYCSNLTHLHHPWSYASTSHVVSFSLILLLLHFRFYYWSLPAALFEVKVEKHSSLCTEWGEKNPFYASWVWKRDHFSQMILINLLHKYRFLWIFKNRIEVYKFLCQELVKYSNSIKMSIYRLSDF